MQLGAPAEDSSWSSSGLKQSEALSRWREWASSALAPLDVRVADRMNFAAHWKSYGVGPLRFVEMGASAQQVIHPGQTATPHRAPQTFQLVYSRSAPLGTQVGNTSFIVKPGEFVLLDNARFYQMEMDSYHEAIDLVMPWSWLERWLPDPTPFLGKPLSAAAGWGVPLGSLLDTIARNLGDADMPRSLIADQVGALLSMATGFHTPISNQHRARLTQRIKTQIADRFADPELTLEAVATTLGISKRYIHVLLSESGTSFVKMLNGTRLDHAAAMLSDQRRTGMQVSEIAWQSGFMDAGYFGRLFRRRYGIGPKEWRALRRDG